MKPAGTGAPHIVAKRRAGKPTVWYIYGWRGGPKIRTATQERRPVITGSDIQAIAEARANAPDPRAGTIAGLVRDYRASSLWRGLQASTRATWDPYLAEIETRWETIGLHIFDDPRMTRRILAWRDGYEATPRAADERIKVLRGLLNFGMLQGQLKLNAAAPIKSIWKGGQRAEIIWLPADNAAFDAVAPQWLVDARRLAEHTGLRRADLIALEWSDVFDTHITRTAAKLSRGKRQRVTVPITPGLRALLAELRDHRPNRRAGVNTVLVGEMGKALAGATLTSQFCKYRNLANDGAGIWHPGDQALGIEAKAKTLHDVRGTFATHLMTLPGAQLTDNEIARIMGWTPEQVGAIRAIYVDANATIVALASRIAARGL